MTPDILLVFGILVVVMVILVTEWMPLEVLALLVLGGLALSGLVTPVEALAGFSNPAVITIWAVFILSGGLTRTGIANILGRSLLTIGGSGDARLIIVIMTIAGCLSAFMNNVAVAALMLPVVMDIARKTRRPPSRLLLPLAYGSLLGGLTTMIGTPPNILVSEALRTNGLTPFGLFDFSPIGLLVMVVGILFVTFIGIRLLPRSRQAGSIHENGINYLGQYRLQDRIFRISVPAGSTLVGKTLARSRLGRLLGLNVIGIRRGRETLLAPEIGETIEAGDELIVEGHLDHAQEMNHWGQLLDDGREVNPDTWFSAGMQVAEVRLSDRSALVGKLLGETGFRAVYRLNVLTLIRGAHRIGDNLRGERLHEGDVLVVHGAADRIRRLEAETGLALVRVLETAEVQTAYPFGRHIRQLRVPDASRLLGLSLAESRLGDAVDVQILCIIRQDGTSFVPRSEDRFEPGDRLVIAGLSDMAAILLIQGLEGIFIEDHHVAADLSELENDKVGLVEVILSPHSTLTGQSLQELSFREKYGLTVLAIWRRGKPCLDELRTMELQFGDALVLYGPWRRLAVLGREPDFLVLTGDVQEPAREEKAATALFIMAAVLLPVIAGWVPIYIAVVIGAACMVLSGCLTMDEAYRFIEWKAVFLIAGMLPLGVALDTSGAASLVAERVIGLLGPFGPHAILFGLLVITFLATSIIPTAALVVLMVPIALETSAGLGISPYPLMMGIAMAASSSFTSPISHPANVLVMGPGGYRFMDYVRVGVPLTLVVLVVLMVFIPLLWPLTLAR